MRRAHGGQQKGAAPAGRVQDAGRALEGEVFGHLLAEPVGGVVLAQGLSGAYVDEVLVHSFENVGLGAGKVVVGNLVGNAAESRQQALEILRHRDPLVKVTFYEVADLELVENVAGENLAHLLVVDVGILGE